MSWQNDICDTLGGILAVKKMEKAMIDLLREMIEVGCDINKKEWRGCPAWATLLDDSEVPASVIKFVLENGGLLQTDEDETPLLFRAISSGMSAKVIELLVKYGADAAYVSKDENETALQLACHSREYGIDTLSLLLEHGCPINVQKLDCGNSALGNAAISDRESEVLEFLIKKGADIHAEDAEGDTPLMRLCGNTLRSPESVEVFINAGADLNHMNHEGYSALGLLCANYGCQEMLEVLVNHGMDANATEHGFTSPMIAALNANWEAVEKLFALGFTNSDVIHPETGETLAQVLERKIEDHPDDEVVVRIRELIAKLDSE